MNEKDAVVVTDTGVFSSIGCSCKSFWQSLVSDVRKISTINPEGHKTRISSEAQSSNLTDYIPLKLLKTMASVLSLALSVVVEVFKDRDFYIDIAANEARGQKLKAAILNSFGFGG